MRSEEEYANLLGMFGVVLAHLGGRVDIPQHELIELDLTTKEFKEWYCADLHKFIFELVDVEDE